MAQLNRTGTIYLVRIGVSTLLQGVILFISAGTLDFPRGWLFFGITIVYILTSNIVLAVKNPELVNARGERKKDTKPFDRIILPFYMLSIFATLIVAGLDAGRFNWTPLHVWWIGPGISILLFSSVLVNLAIHTNIHFESTVRIQTDRDHRVISNGPYAVIRHPGYAAGILWIVSIPMITGSLTAFIPALGSALCVVVRTVLEDRTLKAELAGYREYSEKVRYRLVPLLW